MRTLSGFSYVDLIPYDGHEQQVVSVSDFDHNTGRQDVCIGGVGFRKFPLECVTMVLVVHDEIMQ